MKVLMISGDKNLLVPGTGAYARLTLQRGAVERLDVFVWPQVHSLRAIQAAVHTCQYDVITAQDPFWRGHMAWHLARKSHAKLNIQVHTDLSVEPLWRRLWARFQLRHADSIRVVSEKIRRQIQTTGAKAPTSLLPVYIDIESFKSLVPQAHVQKTVLWIGRFESEKDPCRAISILKEVRASGVDAKLVMLGAGSLESVMRDFAATLPVEFPGWRDPRQYLPKADVVLSTSRYESWGASIIEALAAGVPVVAPDVGIAREAGATVVEREKLAEAVGSILRSGDRGVLKMLVLSAQEWARAWRDSLI